MEEASGPNSRETQQREPRWSPTSRTLLQAILFFILFYFWAASCQPGGVALTSTGVQLGRHRGLPIRGQSAAASALGRKWRFIGDRQALHRGPVFGVHLVPVSQLLVQLFFPCQKCAAQSHKKMGEMEMGGRGAAWKTRHAIAALCCAVQKCSNYSTVQ